MIPEIREAFNAAFSEEKYRAMIKEINQRYQNSLDFRVCETPLFLSDAFNHRLIQAAEDVIRQIQDKTFLQRMTSAIPPGLAVSHEKPHADFLAIDFAITRDASGRLMPQLIELQGFPTTFCFEWMLDDMIRHYFAIPTAFCTFYGGLDKAGFLEKLRRMLLGDSDPENVILLEIQPQRQKTRIDFGCTQRHLGIRPVCVTDVIKRGKRIFYRHEGREILIERIYNRMIFDELIRKNITCDFCFAEDLEIVWMPHPNWFFKISKFSLPALDSPYCPDCYYLEELREYPPHLENFVLKPLFSFAGSGVELNVTAEKLRALENKQDYILQRKVDYAPVLQTPEGPAKAEVRMVFFWEDRPRLVQNHVRISRGKMMGVDFNRENNWVGSSIAYHAG